MTITHINGPTQPEHVALIQRVDRLAAKIQGCLDERQGDGPAAPGSAYADDTGDIYGYAEDIGTYLALWSMRDGNTGTPEHREAANAAMDAIDGLTRDLHKVRSRLVGEIRAYDDETARRVDALLAKHREEAGL